MILLVALEFIPGFLCTERERERERERGVQSVFRFGYLELNV